MARIGKLRSLPNPNTYWDTIKVTFETASGGDSGATAGAAWNKFPVNTEVLDTGNFCTIASGQITLLAGTYEFFDAAIRAFQPGVFNLRFRNISDSANVSGLTCLGGYSTTSEVVGSITGRFAIAATKTFEIQAYCGAGQAIRAWGVESSAGVAEVYGTIGLRKIV